MRYSDHSLSHNQSLRCLVKVEDPLSDGYLTRCKVIIPNGVSLGTLLVATVMTATSDHQFDGLSTVSPPSGVNASNSELRTINRSSLSDPSASRRGSVASICRLKWRGYCGIIGTSFFCLYVLRSNVYEYPSFRSISIPDTSWPFEGIAVPQSPKRRTVYAVAPSAGLM